MPGTDNSISSHNESWQWLAIELLCCNLQDQEDQYRKLSELSPDGRKVLNLYTWGGFDVSRLALFNDEYEATEFCQDTPDHTFFNRQVLVGAALRLPEADWSEIVPRLPLIGITLAKFQHGHRVEEWKEWLLRRLEEIHLQHNMAGEIEYCVAAGTGWADVLLIQWSNQFALIKKTIIELRSWPKREAPPEPRFITTCTIPGTWLDYGKETNPSEDRLQAWRKLISTMTDSPGDCTPVVHLQGDPHNLYRLSEVFYANKDLLTNVSLGRSDVIGRPRRPEEYSTKQYFQFWHDAVLPVLNDLGQGLASTETLWCLNAKPPNVLECDGNDVPAREVLSDVDPAPLRDYVSPHTFASLMQIRRALSAVLRDKVMSVHYTSLAECFESVISNARRLVQQGIPTPLRVKTLNWDLNEFCENVDLCFKDRYRGAYPAGETSAIVSVSTRGSFHKPLLLADRIVGGALEAIRDSLVADGVLNSDEVPRLVACCHLNNSSTPLVKLSRNLGFGFINVPLPLMFRPQDMFYLLHEVGHIFWDSYFLRGEAAFAEQVEYPLEILAAKYRKSEKWRNVGELDGLDEETRVPDISFKVLEVLCDFVQLCVAFGRQAEERMESRARSVVLRLSPRYESARKDAMRAMSVRCECATKLAEIMMREDTRAAFDEVVNIYREEARKRAADSAAQALKHDGIAAFFQAIGDEVRTNNSFGRILRHFLKMGGFTGQGEPQNLPEALKSLRQLVLQNDELRADFRLDCICSV